MSNDLLKKSVSDAIEYYCTNPNGDLLFDTKDALHIIMQAKRVNAIKASGDDYGSTNAKYHTVITESLLSYFTGGNVTTSKNNFKKGAVDAFNDMFDRGWLDGEGELPADKEAIDWLQTRIEMELGFIEMTFQNAKELKKEKDFDYFSWVTSRADGFTGTLKEIYNYAYLYIIKDQMVTFDGDDGAESCVDCTRLKGKRHKISWFVNRDLIPPYGKGLECHPGGHCQHGLKNDKGEWVTV